MVSRTTREPLPDPWKPGGQERGFLHTFHGILHLGEKAAGLHSLFHVGVTKTIPTFHGRAPNF
jgi:hypothetical protein